MRRSPRRPGFTLLEVLLAALIAVLLLAGLYFAMDVTVRQTQEGRDALEVDNASRGVFHRMTIDLSGALAPLPPKSGGNAATGTLGGTSVSVSTSTSVTVSAGTTSTAISSATSSSASVGTSTSSATQPQADIGFQAGVIGTDTQLTIFVSRLPHALADAGVLLQPTDATVQTPSDQYRVTYWKGQNGQLCRQERPWVTADGIRDTYDPDLSNEAGDTLAEEITDVQFKYFDGSDWVDSWDGTTPGPDGVTPQGPPRAVKVTLTFSIPSSRPGTPPITQTAIQVIPVRAAPGLLTPQLIMPDTDPGTTSSSSSSSGSSGSSGSGSNSSSGMSGGGSKGSSSGSPAAGAPTSSGAGGSSSAPKSSSTGGASMPATSGGTSGGGSKSSGSTGTSSGSKGGGGK
ncbi:MAG: hypothetical protein JWO38_1717 [Gemmataceae bacterium]|nr:hypothetical protein [Gemmataceae bacterium]